MQLSGRSVLLLCAMATLSSAARAQVVASSQPLDFGPLVAGVVEIVTATDAARRADIAIQGTSSSTASLTVVLPTSLTATTGATVPLQFQPGDVIFEPAVGQGPTTVNLQGTTSIRLHRTREGRLYIGGRALPAVGQRAGAYSATIVVIVAPTGA